MTVRVLVDGLADAAISPLDRGLAYGDGLFETLLFVQGKAPRWHRHMARLSEGCTRLALPMPEPGVLGADCERVVAGLQRAAVRISWTRGVGERGYAMPAVVRPTRVVAASAAPSVPDDWYRLGIRIRCCSLRLSMQPHLAGIKHCNRLEQVIARNEWNDPAIAEGLLFNINDDLIGATAANVFAVIGGCLTTPELVDCGVAGVTRADILERYLVDVRAISREELLRADEIFLCSALRGIIPVNRIDAREFAVGAVTRTILQDWRLEHGLAGVVA